MENNTKKFVAMNLPRELVEELKVWKTAYSLTYGKSMTYGDIITSLLCGVEKTDPEVYEEMTRMVNAHPDLMKKLFCFCLPTESGTTEETVDGGGALTDDAADADEQDGDEPSELVNTNIRLL